MKTIKKIAIANLVLSIVLLILLPIGIVYILAGLYSSVFSALVGASKSNNALDISYWIRWSCLAIVIPIIVMSFVMIVKIKNPTYKTLLVFSVLFIPLTLVVCSMIIHTKKDLTQINIDKQNENNSNNNLVNRLPE